MKGESVERFRPLLPVGYEATARAYREAAAELDAGALSDHYTSGLELFHGELVPRVKQVLHELSGGAWDLEAFDAYSASGDVDFMTHVVDAVAGEGSVALYPGDWYGFLVGASQRHGIEFRSDARGADLACLCVPSVRNGHLTTQMLEFLDGANSCLVNVNLFPTLPAPERRDVARSLSPLLGKSILSVSFSRGFGLTASQLGVVLVHPDHELRRRYHEQWNWFTYFFNLLAARAFLRLDPAELQAVDDRRREWVHAWLEQRGLPMVESGSYYVKSFRVEGDVPEALEPLARGDLLRLCFKPPYA